MLIHVVEPRETVSSIANTYGVSVQSVIADNDLREPYLLAVGQTLVIQFPQEIYVVKQGQTLSEIAWLSGQSLNPVSYTHLNGFIDQVNFRTFYNFPFSANGDRL